MLGLFVSQRKLLNKYNIGRVEILEFEQFKNRFLSVTYKQPLKVLNKLVPLEF